MPRYADPERCPDCLAAMPFGSSSCPSCGLVLTGPVAARLFATLSAADELLATLRSPRPGEPGLVPTAAGTAPRRRPGLLEGLSAASVPKILLGLGALCLLVAALVFLAVAWSAMGVAGRTATLLGFTVVAGALTAWSARHDLRAAAEALGVVTLGLLTFDLVGAREAGWLAGISAPGFLVLVGAVLVVAGAAAALVVRRTPARRLVGAEVFAAAGVACIATGGVVGELLTTSAALVLAVVLAAAVCLAARAVRLTVLSAGAGLVALVAWLMLAGSSWDRALLNPSLDQLWRGLEVWPLLAAAALVGAPALVRGLALPWRLAAVGGAALVLAAAGYAPLTDASPTSQALGAAGLVLVFSLLTWVTPRPWSRGVVAPAAVAGAGLAVVALTLAGQALQRVVAAGTPVWGGRASDALPAAPAGGLPAAWLLPVAVLAVLVTVVALARCFVVVDRAVAPLLRLDVVALGVLAVAALTLASYPVPVWTVLAVLLAAGAGAVVRTVTTPHWTTVHRVTLASGALFLTLGQVLALHAEALTLAALVVVLAAAAAVHLRAPRLEVAAPAGALAAAALAALVWTAGAVADAAAPWVALVALLALAGLALAGPLVDLRLRVSSPATYARLGTELGALVAAAAVLLAGVGLAPLAAKATWLAVYLTVSGATVCAMALLRADRRSAGWLGGALLAAATWVLLADRGVTVPEAYTLPSALALLVVGLVRLRRDPASGTMTVLTPGVLLALLPSLVASLEEPPGVRALLLGLACLALVIAGLRTGWSAPLVHGAAVGAVLVLHLAAPAAEAAPRWALIGLAGALLVAMGITWERRVRDARALAGYVRALR